jgi:DNA processing protein
MNASQRVILHLSLIDGIGPQTIQKIAQQIALNDLSLIYQFSVADWLHHGIPQSFAQKLWNGLQDCTLLDREIALIEKHQIEIITIIDEQYPERLREIHMPPPILYCKGRFWLQERVLAFVGSRNANQYGKQIIEQFIPELVMHGFTIISGGAVGADSMAHRATIEAGGTTIIVLGSGLLRPYPYKNKKLFDDAIAAEGGIISIFPLTTDPLPGNFPARNRVIAGLSQGIVVIQAAQKSGTRITAQYALEQGRDVFAVPGSIDDPLSAGCHALITQGATLVTSSGDILQSYGIQKEVSLTLSESKIPLPLNVQLSLIEQQIIALCKQPQSIDEIAQQVHKNLHELQSILFEMQIAGMIEQDFVGLWKTLR